MKLRHPFSLLALAVILISFFACKSQSRTDGKTTIDDNSTVLEGNYDSVKGVMKRLSCFCYNAGYLKTKDGNSIPLCFKNEQLDVNCAKIKVKGKYETVKIDPGNDSPCTPGEMEIFMAKSFDCQ